MSVDDVSLEPRKILMEPPVAVFQHCMKRAYVKKSNSVRMKGYNSKIWRSRKLYHRAKHKHDRIKTNANYVNLIIKSKLFKNCRK